MLLGEGYNVLGKHFWRGRIFGLLTWERLKFLGPHFWNNTGPPPLPPPPPIVNDRSLRMKFKIKIYKIKIWASLSINLHPSFKAFFKFANVNFVREEMVWQTIPFFDDSHEERVLKGVNFSSFSFYFLWMVGSSVFTSTNLEIVIKV